MMRALLAMAVTAILSACVWQPIVYDESAQASVDKAVAEFRREEALVPFFDEALAYAVFPGSFRAGTGFGGAFGGGWLLEDGDAVGRVTLFEFFAGADLGAQVYRTILFFKSEKGAHAGDVFMSLIYTCELCGANSFDYLTELQRHANELASDPQNWMPWNYRETLDAISTNCTIAG